MNNIIKNIGIDVLNMYNNFYNTDINNLSNLHLLLNNDKVSIDTKNYYKTIPIFGVNDRNNEFINLFYHNYDIKNSALSKNYLELMHLIKKTYYPEEEYIVIQKTPNIRIHFPNCSNIGRLDTDKNEDIIGLHNDRMFGHSHSEMNLIVAFTDMYDTNSIFVEPEKGDISEKDYKAIEIKENNLSFHYLNKLKHYNKINKTNKTRVSFDIRIIPFSQYEESKNKSATTNTKFTINNYYIKI